MAKRFSKATVTDYCNVRIAAIQVRRHFDNANGYAQLIGRKCEFTKEELAELIEAAMDYGTYRALQSLRASVAHGMDS